MAISPPAISSVPDLLYIVREWRKASPSNVTVNALLELAIVASFWVLPPSPGTVPPLQCDGSGQLPLKPDAFACQKFVFAPASEMVPPETLKVSPAYEVEKWIVCSTLFDASLTVKVVPSVLSVALAAFATWIASLPANPDTTPLNEFGTGDVSSSTPPKNESKLIFAVLPTLPSNSKAESFVM